MFESAGEERRAPAPLVAPTPPDRIGDPMIALPRPPLAARMRLGLAALAVLASLTGPARAQSVAERIVGDWAESLRASGRGVEWSGLARSEAGDRLELRDLVVTLPAAADRATRIEIPSLTVVGLAERGDGGVAFASLVVPRLTLTGRSGDEDGVLRLADVEIVDAVVPKPVFPPFDADHPFAALWTASRVLDPFAAARASIGRLTAGSGRAGGKEKSEITVTDFGLVGLRDGRVERLHFGSAKIEAVADKGRARLSIADVEIAGLDPTAWRRLWDDRDYVGGKGDGVWRRTLASAHTGRIALETDDTRLSIDRLVAGERSVRQFDEPLGRWVDRLLTDPDRVQPPDSLRLVLEDFLSSRHQGWTIEGLRLTGPDLEHADVARLTVGPASGERLAEITVEGVDVVAQRALLRLGRFTVADLRLPDADDLRRAIPAAAAGAEIDPSSLMPRLGHAALERLELAEPGVPALRLAALRLDLDRWIRAVPTALSLTLDHLVVPAGLADAEGRRTLAGLGYDRIDVSAALRLAWSEANREVAVETARLAIADVGSIDLSARLVGVTRAFFTRPDTAALLLGDVRLAEARATITDASFTDRLIRLLARDDKTKPDRIRRRLGDEIAGELSGIRDPARRRKAIAVVRRFLAAPGTLRLLAHPKAPVPLVELWGMTDDLFALTERLDFSVSSER